MDPSHPIAGVRINWWHLSISEVVSCTVGWTLADKESLSVAIVFMWTFRSTKFVRSYPNLCCYHSQQLIYRVLYLLLLGYQVLSFPWNLYRQFVILTVLHHKTERLSSDGVGRCGEGRCENNHCRHLWTGECNCSMEFVGTVETVSTFRVVGYKHT